MSKEIFRYLRGELNGFYIRNIQTAWNTKIKDIKEFFTYFNKAQFYNNTLSDSDLRGLGIFAGIFLPRIAQEEATTSLKMTESFEENGYEFSERGLYNTDNETFDFKNLNSDITEPDINTLATPKLRSSLVGNEDIKGYISSDSNNVTDIINAQGLVRPEKILNEPPSNIAYSEFYGNQFLFLSENQITYSDISYTLYSSLFKILQKIKFSGATLDTLSQTIQVLCPELVKITSIDLTQDKSHFIISYVYDENVNLPYKNQRVSLLNYILRIKFPLFALQETIGVQEI